MTDRHKIPSSIDATQSLLDGQNYVADRALSTVLFLSLTIWVARTLHKNGRVFLVDVFHGNDALADSVNHLLVVGFYLINFGYVSMALTLGYVINNAQESIEALSVKIGMVLIVAPENVEVRFLRGTTSQRLPALMGRRAVARQDLAYAASAAPAAVASGELGLDIAAASLFHYGMLCDAEGNQHEAQEAWRAASNLGPDTPAGRRAQRMIPARTSPR